MASSVDGEDEEAATLVDALLVYAEPLAASAHTVVVGDSESPVAERLLDFGARSVQVFDPDPARAANAARTAPRGVTVRALGDELDVRDGSFDLAIIPDLAEASDPRGLIGRLRRAVASNGSVVAMSRARSLAAEPFPEDLGPAMLEYGELYDLFASEFDDVALAGVVPFTGVVFARLGSEEEEPAVSVDTRLVAPDSPSVFVIVASQEASRGRRPDLDPYAIVQVDEEVGGPIDQSAVETAFAAMQLKSELVSAQIDDLRERLVVADVRTVETAARLERAGAERDAALTRAMELEAILAAAQAALLELERRVLEADRGILDRDDRLAILSAELDARASSAMHPLAEARAAETRAAEAHAAETAGYESQLRDRARVVATLEKELLRREHMVKELVAALQEKEEKGETGAPTFEASEPLSMPPPRPRPDPALLARVAELEAKLDELAGEIARREGELTARAWRIAELENAAAAAPVAASTTASVDGRVKDELDALRQALAQEHAARVAAESGEALSHARSELARQAVLLDQISAQRSRS